MGCGSNVNAKFHQKTPSSENLSPLPLILTELWLPKHLTCVQQSLIVGCPFRPVLDLIGTSRGFIKVFWQYIWTIKPKAHNYYWQCRLIHPKKHPCRCQSPFRLIFSLFWALSRPPEVVKRCFRGTSGLKTEVP